jgi:hypothetical protein
MPDATLAARREALRGLLSGRAVRVEDAANTVGLPVVHVIDRIVAALRLRGR